MGVGSTEFGGPFGTAGDDIVVCAIFSNTPKSDLALYGSETECLNIVIGKCFNISILFQKAQIVAFVYPCINETEAVSCVCV